MSFSDSVQVGYGSSGIEFSCEGREDTDTGWMIHVARAPYASVLFCLDFALVEMASPRDLPYTNEGGNAVCAASTKR
jgi:hypothetical protein